MKTITASRAIFGALALTLSIPAWDCAAAVIDFEEFHSSAPLDVSVIDDLIFTRCSYPAGSSGCVSTGVYVRNTSAMYGQINLASSGLMGAEVVDGLSIRALNGSSFDFVSAYFGMTHPFDSPVNIFTGIRNGQVVYSANIVSGQSPTLNQLNWQSIDEVKVTSQYNTGYFIMDDIQYSMSSVPVPAAARF